MSAYRDLDEARAERFATETEPRYREYAEPWPPAWFDADLRAESDALWGESA